MVCLCVAVVLGCAAPEPGQEPSISSAVTVSIPETAGSTPTLARTPTSMRTLTSTRTLTSSQTPRPSRVPASATCTASPSPAASPTVTPTHTAEPPLTLVASYPVDGDQAVVGMRPLILVFDHPVDDRSVEASLTISPTVAGQIGWPSEERLHFTPTTAWQADIAYELVLANGTMAPEDTTISPGVRLRFRSAGRGVPVPILMYHHVLTLDESPTEGQLTWTVSPEAFAAQMRYLASEGWQTVTPRQLATYLTQGEPLPPRPLIITIDDGYREIYSDAFPILQEAGLEPTLFVVPEYVGYGAYMDWPQLEALAGAGFVIGSHGYDHSNLRKADDEELLRQIADSQAVLSEHLHVTVDAFCYPFGSYDERVMEMLEAHGYVAAFTLNPTIYQSPEKPYLLNRRIITYATTLDEFAELLP